MESLITEKAIPLLHVSLQILQFGQPLTFSGWGSGTGAKTACNSFSYQATDVQTGQHSDLALSYYLGNQYTDSWRKVMPFHSLNEVYAQIIKFLVIIWYFDLSRASVLTFYGIRLWFFILNPCILCLSKSNKKIKESVLFSFITR